MKLVLTSLMILLISFSMIIPAVHESHLQLAKMDGGFWILLALGVGYGGIRLVRSDKEDKGEGGNPNEAE